MQVFERDGNRVTLFDSLSDCVDGVRPLADVPWGGRIKQVIHDARWLGRDFEAVGDAFDACLQPWEHGVEQVHGMLDDLERERLPRPVSRRRRQIWREDTGEEFSLDRMRSGLPYWRGSRRELTHSIGTLTLCAYIGGNHAIPHDDLLWRGAACLALSSMLEDAGYRTEVWAAAFAHDSYTDMGSSGFGICLKRPAERIDLDGVACVMSGWFFRTVVIAAKGAFEKRVNAYWGAAPLTIGNEWHGWLPVKDPIWVENVYCRNDAIARIREVLEQLRQPLKSAV